MPKMEKIKKDQRGKAVAPKPAKRSTGPSKSLLGTGAANKAANAMINKHKKLKNI